MTLSPRLWAWLFTLGILAAWAVAGTIAPAYLLPGPAPVFAGLAALLADHALRPHVWASLLHIGGAILIAFLLGSALALLAHHARWARPFIQRRLTPFLNAFSGIGWTLLAVIWFGIDAKTVIFTIVVILLPFALVNIGQGLEALNQEYLEMGKSFTGSRLRRFRLIVLPLLAPFLFATLRLCFGISWKVALTAELLGGDSGLGYLMNLAMQEQNTERILSIALFIVLFVYAMDGLLLERIQRLVAVRFEAKS